MIKEWNGSTDKEKILRFLENSAYSDYMQDIKWNIVRNEEEKYYLYSIEEGVIKWVCNILVKGYDEKFLYAPRGPILDYSNKDNIATFFREICEWMNLKKYNKLVMNPCILPEILQNFPGNLQYSLTGRQDYNHLMDSCKLAVMNVIFDEEKLIQKLPSKFRQNTRRSYRKGLVSRISKNVDFDNFYKLYLQTALRHDFHPHDLEYFKKICETYNQDLIFLEVWYDDFPLAMSIDIKYKDKLIYLYGVSSSERRNLLGMYHLQWEAIKYCIKNNIPKYDFGGVFCEENDINNKDFGLYNFKKGYCYDGFIDVVSDINITLKKEVKKND